MRPPLIAFLVLAACASNAPSALPPRAPEPPAPAQRTGASGGVFPTTLVPPANHAFMPMYRRLVEVGNPAGIGRLVERLYGLHGFAVPIVVKECGEESAFYAPRSRTITICYEILRYANDLAGKSGNDRYTLDRNALITVVYFTLHEIGHALIDVLALSLYTDEEEMADQFAFLVATSADDAALVADLIKAPASFLHRHGAAMHGGRARDEHRHGDERAFAALCLLYGRLRNPEVGEALGADAARCIADTARVVDAWNQALAPYSSLDDRTPQTGLAPLAEPAR
jgi:hypothetical protein